MRFQFDHRPGQLSACLRRFANDERGATAIEFAAVIGPFLFLLFGIMSVGFYFFVVFSLEHAVESASRVIRTGQEQTMTSVPSGTPTSTAGQPASKADWFRQQICNKLPPFMHTGTNCNAIRINVQKFAGYGSITTPSCLNNTGALIPASSQTYNTGDANEIVLVSVCYEWELTRTMISIPYWISPGAGRMTNGSTLIQAATTFTNEPFR